MADLVLASLRQGLLALRGKRSHVRVACATATARALRNGPYGMLHGLRVDVIVSAFPLKRGDDVIDIEHTATPRTTTQALQCCPQPRGVR